MPKAGTLNAQEHLDALRSAYESKEARKAGIPEGIMTFGVDNKCIRSDAYYDWVEEMKAAKTANKCGRCHRIRFGAINFLFQKEKTNIQKEKTNDTSIVYNTQWAFISKGRKVCVVCADKGKEERQATKPKTQHHQSSTPPSPPLANTADTSQTALLQKMLDMMEGMQHQIQQLVETNAEITADNQALQERVIKMSFALQHITTEVESLNNKQDKIQYMLQKKTGMSLEDLEPEYDAERDDPIWDEGPGKFINDEEEPESI